MYLLQIITAIGMYTVEMTPDKEEPTNDDLMNMFLNTQSDIQAGCFMEGWTPEDSLSGPPGVFALGEDLEILAYHVVKVQTKGVPINPGVEAGPLPLTIKAFYLGNELTAKCVFKRLEEVYVILCYEVNGEPPADVLDAATLTKQLSECIETDMGYDADEYLLKVADDGGIRNFSQAVDMLEMLEENYKTLRGKPTGKAWTGWKGDGE